LVDGFLFDWLVASLKPTPHTNDSVKVKMRIEVYKQAKNTDQADSSLD